MNSHPFKFRYINRIAGSFIFLASIILIIFAVLAGKSQMWFAETTEYRVKMPGGRLEGVGGSEKGGTLGITPGSDVRVIGSLVGHVKRVELCRGDDLVPISSFEDADPNEIRIVGVLQVKGDFAKFIGPDSKVVLKFDLGGLGAAFFDISRGSKPFPPSPDPSISHILKFDQEANAKEQAFETIKRVENELIPAIQSFKELSVTSTALVEKLSKDDEALFRLLSSLEVGVGDLNKIIGRIQNGEGALGDMISSDSDMRKQFNEFAVTLNRSSTSLEKAIANLDQGITRLREGGVEPLNRAVEKFPTTIGATNEAIYEYNEAALQLQETIREIEVLTIGLQKHWLVKNLIVDPVEDQPPGSAAAAAKQKQTPRPKPSESEKQGGLFKGLFKKKESP